MKSTSLFYLGLSFFAPTTCILGQNKGTSVATEFSTSTSPFTRGNIAQLPTSRFNYDNLISTQPGQADIKKNTTEFRLGADYFVADNIAVGAEFSGDFSGMQNLYEYNNRKWMASLNLTYGVHFNDHFNMYAKAGAGYGLNTMTTKSGSNSFTAQDKMLGYHFTIGAPISFQPGSEIYLTPLISYRGESTTFDGGKQMDNRFEFGLQFNSYLSPDQFACGSNRKNLNYSWNKYDKGTSFFEITDMGSFGINNRTISYNNNFSDKQTENSSCGSFCVDYHYYPINYFAVGLEGRISNQVLKIQGGNDKTTKFDYSAGPSIRINFPTQDWVHNLFIQGGIGFGGSRNVATGDSVQTTDTGDSTVTRLIPYQSTLKYNFTDFSVGLGYNHFVTDRIPITVGFGYRWSTRKEDNTANTLKTTGWSFRMGFGYYFN